MTRPIKLADVARAAGVSQGTVSNVFNRPERVSPSLRERVESAARNLGYRGPDPRGRLLRAGRVNAIGFVANAPIRSFFGDGRCRRFLAGVADECEHFGSGLSLISTARDAQAVWNLSTAVVDGFILDCLDGDSGLVDLAVRRGLPFVAVDHPSDPRFDVVAADERYAGRTAAEHLLALGHTRIAILRPPVGDDASQPDGNRTPGRPLRAEAVASSRLDGCRDALAGAGLAPGALTVLECTEDLAAIAAALGQHVGGAKAATALIGLSRTLAEGALRHLHAVGRRVPEEVSVVGFCDATSGSAPGVSLTVMEPPVEEMGWESVRLVFMPRRPGQPGRTALIPGHLVPNGSTARAP